MGININCSRCKNIEDKQTFSFRRKLLDILRKYLKEQNYEKELKLIHWFYREENDDEERVLTITEEEKTEALELLKEKELDGLFFWIFLDEDDTIRPYQAGRFLKTYNKIKHLMDEKFYNLHTIYHCYNKGHDLECW